MRSFQLLALIGYVAAKTVIPLPPIVNEIQEALGIQVGPAQDLPGRFPFAFNLISKTQDDDMAGQQAYAQPVDGDMTYDVNERGQFRSPEAFAAAITNQSGLPGPFAGTVAEVAAQGSQTLLDLNKSMMRWLETLGEQMFDPASAYAPVERGFRAAAEAAPDSQMAATIPVLGNLLRLIAVPVQGLTDGVQAVAVQGPIAEMHSWNRVLEHISPVELQTDEMVAAQADQM